MVINEYKIVHRLTNVSLNALFKRVFLNVPLNLLFKCEQFNIKL